MALPSFKRSVKYNPFWDWKGKKSANIIEHEKKYILNMCLIFYILNLRKNKYVWKQDSFKIMKCISSIIIIINIILVLIFEHVKEN